MIPFSPLNPNLETEKWVEHVHYSIGQSIYALSILSYPYPARIHKITRQKYTSHDGRFALINTTTSPATGISR